MGVFKLGKMTFGSLFKKPETVLYPIEKKPQPEGLKGHIVIDAPACILCGMCERSCPTDCITVDKANRTWQIDRFGCVQCGYCVTACPKDCLAMDPDYAAPSTARSAETVEVPAQEKEPAKASEAAKPAEPVKAAADAASAPKADKAAEEAPETSAVPLDKLVEEKLSLMDGEKAEKVRSALAR